MNLSRQEVIDITPWCIRIQPAAAMSEELRTYINNKGMIDFGNSNALNAYNKAAVKVMAGLDIEIPEGNLVPTACLRQAYLTILCAELLNPGTTIAEIGTGATAIIAMLAAKNFKLNVIATEIDPISHASATKNIQRNSLQDQITLVRSKGEILKGLISPNDVQAVLCYPPTYPEDDSDIYRQKHKSGFQGTISEMIGGGNDGYQFIEKYIDEAIELEIKLITILLIFKDHKDKVIQQIKDRGREIQTITLQAGTRKRYLIISQLIDSQ